MLAILGKKIKELQFLQNIWAGTYSLLWGSSCASSVLTSCSVTEGHSWQSLIPAIYLFMATGLDSIPEVLTVHVSNPNKTLNGEKDYSTHVSLSARKSNVLIDHAVNENQNDDAEEGGGGGHEHEVMALTVRSQFSVPGLIPVGAEDSDSPAPRLTTVW